MLLGEDLKNKMLRGSNNAHRPGPAVCGLWSPLFTPGLWACEGTVLGLPDLGWSPLHHFSCVILGSPEHPWAEGPASRGTVSWRCQWLALSSPQRRARAYAAEGLCSSSCGGLVEWDLFSGLAVTQVTLVESRGGCPGFFPIESFSECSSVCCAVCRGTDTPTLCCARAQLCF